MLNSIEGRFEINKLDNQSSIASLEVSMMVVVVVVVSVMGGSTAAHLMRSYLSLPLFLSFFLFSCYSKTQPPEQNNCLHANCLLEPGCSAISYQPPSNVA